MSDLPIPMPQSMQSAAPPTPSQAVPAASGQFNTADVGMSGDPKDLLLRASEQVESIISATLSNPAQRASDIHTIKAAYLKARYNVDASRQLPYGHENG